MSKTPEWSKVEFDILLHNSQISDAELTQLLPRRTVGAIGWVRNGIHSFHRGGNISMLSKMMIHHLEQGKDQLVCPRCLVRI